MFTKFQYFEKSVNRLILFRVNNLSIWLFIQYFFLKFCYGWPEWIILKIDTILYFESFQILASVCIPNTGCLIYFGSWCSKLTIEIFVITTNVNKIDTRNFVKSGWNVSLMIEFKLNINLINLFWCIQIRNFGNENFAKQCLHIRSILDWGTLRIFSTMFKNIRMNDNLSGRLTQGSNLMTFYILRDKNLELKKSEALYSDSLSLKTIKFLRQLSKFSWLWLKRL